MKDMDRSRLKTKPTGSKFATNQSALPLLMHAVLILRSSRIPTIRTKNASLASATTTPPSRATQSAASASASTTLAETSATSAALASTATLTMELKTTVRRVPVLLAANVLQRQQCHKELQMDLLLFVTDVRLDRKVPAASVAWKTSLAIHLECTARTEFAKTANATEISTSWKPATATRLPENVSNASTTLKVTTASNAWTVSTAIQALS